MGQLADAWTGFLQRAFESCERDVDGIVLDSEMAGGVAPEEGYEDAVPFPTYQAGRAQIARRYPGRYHIPRISVGCEFVGWRDVLHGCIFVWVSVTRFARQR